MSNTDMVAGTIAIDLRVPMATHLTRADIDAFNEVVASRIAVASELVRPGIFAPDGRRIGGTMQPYAVFIGIACFVLGQAVQIPANVVVSLLADGAEALFRRRRRLGDAPTVMPVVVIEVVEGEGEHQLRRHYATIPGDHEARREAFASLAALAPPGPDEPGYEFDPSTRQWKPAKR